MKHRFDRKSLVARRAKTRQEQAAELTREAIG
jgi:hypothetical protein